MQKLLIEETEKTPYIIFDYDLGLLEIKGKSVPEDSYKFFNPANIWLDNYIINPAASTKLKVALEYFNTSSAKVLLEMFKKMKQLNKSGKSQIEIQWVYEEDDDDMLEAGKDYQQTIDVPFNFVAIESF